MLCGIEGQQNACRLIPGPVQLKGSTVQYEIEMNDLSKSDGEGQSVRAVDPWNTRNTVDRVPGGETAGEDPEGEVAGSVRDAPAQIEGARPCSIVELEGLDGSNIATRDALNCHVHGRYVHELCYERRCGGSNVTPPEGGDITIGHRVSELDPGSV